MTDSAVRLSHCDNFQGPYGVRMLSVFRVPPELSSESQVQALRTWWSGLEAQLRAGFVDLVTQHYLPYSGDIDYEATDAQSGERIFVLHVPAEASCDRVQQLFDSTILDDWAPTEAEIANGDLSTWPRTRLAAPYNELPRNDTIRARVALCLPLPGAWNRGCMPIVTVSLTVNHSLSDAAGTIQILRNWASLVRSGSVEVVPCHDRSLLMVDPVPSAHESVAIPRMCSASMPMPRGRLEDKIALVRSMGCNEYRVRFDAEVVTDAQERCSAQCGVRLTKNDIIVASLWLGTARAVVAAEESQLTDEAFLTVPVNVRGGRCQQPSVVPNAYVGNAVVGAVVTFTDHAQLVSSSLAEVAKRVHEDVRSMACDPSAILSVLRWEAARGPRGTRTRANALASLSNHYCASSWMHYGLESVDFGFGASELATSLLLPGPVPRLGFLLPPPRMAVAEGQGALVDACVGLTPQAARFLFADESFIGRCVGVMFDQTCSAVE
jgi:hypothetical protein